MLKSFALLCCVSFSNLLSSTERGWEMTESIWNFGIITQCNIGCYSDPYFYFAENPGFDPYPYQFIRSGDIVWLRCAHVADFQRAILPYTQRPFVLVIADGDESFPSQSGVAIEEFINNPWIIHIFAQNCDYQGSSTKISHLPIGVDFHSIAYKGGYWGERGSPLQQEAALKSVLSTLQPTHMRKVGAFVDFHHNDTTHHQYMRYLEWGEDRASIFQRLLPTGLIEHGPRMDRTELWKMKGQYAFSISPYGNGLDCHRTWEDLILGCIVIVKTSPLDPVFEGLPVVIVKDWSEITRENMEKWMGQYGDAFTNTSYRQKLTNAYWLEKIQEAPKDFKKRKSK